MCQWCVMNEFCLHIDHSAGGQDLRLAYDTIWYDAVDLRALKSWRCGQFNLAHGRDTKNKEKQNECYLDARMRLWYLLCRDLKED